MLVKDARCIGVYGARGSGKTTLVQRLLEGCNRVIAFDPTGQYAREFRWSTARDLGTVHELVRAGWHKGFRIGYTPEGSYPLALHRLCLYLWGIQEPYDLGRDKRKVVLVVEEANLGAPNHRLPADTDAFLKAVLQGRHRGIEIIAVTQRPSLVSKDFRGMLAEKFVLRLAEDDDIKLFGRHAPMIAGLVNHQYVHIADGVATRGENPRLGTKKASRRR